jgi:hypothetical protein
MLANDRTSEIEIYIIDGPVMASQEENLAMSYPNCEKKWFD